MIEVLPSESEEWIPVVRSRDRLPRRNDTRPADKVALADLDKKDVVHLFGKIAAARAAASELAKLSAGPQVYAANFSASPEPTWLLQRGDAMKRGHRVPPAVPAVLGDLELAENTPEQERRLALARHRAGDPGGVGVV